MRYKAEYMMRVLVPAGIGITLVGASFFPSSAQQSGPTAEVASAAAAMHDATLNQYCVACHNNTLTTAGLSLEGQDIRNLSQNGAVWEKVLSKLRNRQMPPAGMPSPPPETYEEIVAYLQDGLDRVAVLEPNPGRPAVHRLNRAEYENVVRDLLALEIDSTELLPPDDFGYGFDNIGDVLTISPLLLERYLSAAEKIALLAIGDPTQRPSLKIYDVPSGLAQNEHMGVDLPFGSRGGTVIRHHFPADAEYVFTVRLQRGKRGNILGLDSDRQLDLRLDGRRLEFFSIPAERRGRPEPLAAAVPAYENLEIRVPAKSGTRSVLATFLYDTIKQEGVIVEEDDIAFFEGVGSISIAGPYNVQGPGATASRERIFVCRPASQADELSCSEEILSTLARRAYRRPISDEDLASLMELYRDGAARGGFETGIRLALQQILVDPEFIFRMEFDPPDAEPGSAYPVSDFALASRLSFFLWSSIPDDELLEVAERGALSNPATLDRQMRRRLADPRSESLVSNFAGQWLFLRNVSSVHPDPVAFPNFDENLRMAMKRETELLVQSGLREDRSVVDLLDSDYTFVNERLARHYGMEGIYGAEFRRVPVTDERRRGLLGHASILTVTSYPDRTAPTIRGKWVLEQLLGTSPPPPPPNVPSLEENENARVLTMRERMEEHRSNPVCATCHQLMDPLGFALENFDGLGRWREVSGDEESVIDASGELPDGTSINGPIGLRNVLLSRQELFVETFTERLLTYALGRGVEYYDFPAIRDITHEAAQSDYSWSSIISGIVGSVPFQMRRAGEG